MVDVINNQGEELLEEIALKYVDASNNNEVTFKIKILRFKEGDDGSLQNDTAGHTGLEASNEEKEEFRDLKESFLENEGNYKHPVGVIVSNPKKIKGRNDQTYFRIDQQSNHATENNIQYQVEFLNQELHYFFNISSGRGENLCQCLC